MAVIKAVNSKASIGKAINYITKDEKTKEKLISGINCNPKTAIDEMKITKKQWRKTEGRQYKHYIQSFNPNDKITSDKAHQIGCELAEIFKGHEVMIATHVDKNHIHNHFIINSVNFENGKKFQQSKKDLSNLKKYSDKICEREGLSVIGEKTNEITTFNQKKYKVIEKGANESGKSYLLDTARDIKKSVKNAISQEEFIKNMEDKGYKVNWKETRQYITFITPEGKNIRDKNLEKTFKEKMFSKEGIDNEIQRNRRIERDTGERRINTKGTIQYNSQMQRDRVSEHTGNEISGRIQREVSAVEDRTNRVIGENGEKDKSTTRNGRDSDKKPKNRIRERDFDIER